MGLFDMFATNNQTISGPQFVLAGKAYKPREYGFRGVNLAIQPTNGFIKAVCDQGRMQNSNSLLNKIYHAPLLAEIQAIAMVAAFFVVIPTLRNNIPHTVLNDTLDAVKEGISDGAKQIYKKQNNPYMAKLLSDSLMYHASAIYKDLANPSQLDSDEIRLNISVTSSAFSKMLFHVYEISRDSSEMNTQQTLDDMLIQQLSTALFLDTLTWFKTELVVSYQQPV